MQIQLLAAVANDAKGAVLDVTEDRALRLIRTGYARVYVPVVQVKRKDKS